MPFTSVNIAYFMIFDAFNLLYSDKQILERTHSSIWIDIVICECSPACVAHEFETSLGCIDRPHLENQTPTSTETITVSLK